MLKQSTFLRRVLSLAIEKGWTISSASDGEAGVKVTTPNGVLEVLRATDMGFVVLRHFARNEKVVLYTAWQGPDETTPNGEEFVYDYSYRLSDDPFGKEVMDPILEAVERN